MTDTIDQLEQIIAARGRGAAFGLAIDLGVDPSMISHWRAGRRKVSKVMARKINDLSVNDRPEDDSHDDTDEQMMTKNDHDDHDHDIMTLAHDDMDATAPAQPVTVEINSLDALEAAVLQASPQDVIDLRGVNIDTSPPLPAPSSAWRNEVWLPIHDMIGVYIGPPSGELIAKHARSAHGAQACAASERVAHRLGIENLMHEGHWLADLAIMGTYVIGVVKISQAGHDQKVTDRAA